MLIKRRQAVFVRDGKGSVTYKLLRNSVQRKIKLAKYHFYYHKVAYLEKTDFLDESSGDLKSLANKLNNNFVSLTDGFEALKYSEPTIQPVPPDLLTLKFPSAFLEDFKVCVKVRTLFFISANHVQLGKR
ncbi:unnamed protein product [Porites evermanni]|uniref:Uncharacterized protein n=1 Tax=Porites evermanni TaxID=104178 RepID=A0ABN8Q066_9CNID|nr:unnamed protein product [Porites evermanni]